MRKLSDKKFNEIFKGKVIRHCYPYCVILDTERNSIAFRNRNYLFLHDYPANSEHFWFQLAPNDFDALHTYLVKTNGVHEQTTHGERFLEYYLYDDGNAPMYNKTDFNRYRKILDKVIALAHVQTLEFVLMPSEHGFDFGKETDGVYIPRNDNESVDVYDTAREEMQRYVELGY